jgi:hypothetical protein
MAIGLLYCLDRVGAHAITSVDAELAIPAQTAKPWQLTKTLQWTCLKAKRALCQAVWLGLRPSRNSLQLSR